MVKRAAGVFVVAALAVGGPAAGVQAQDSTTNPFPGITLIKRTLSLPSFRCPGCPGPTPSPRIARINVALIDLTAPEIRFKMTPAGTNLPPPPAVPPNGFPLPSPPYETVRQRTLDFLEASHAQLAVNVHFFAPFPSSLPNAYVIGLSASRGNVYSAFESPFQNYAIVTDSPALNIDSANQASIVHRDPSQADGLHVLEDVPLWNALSGSAQIVTNGVTTIPEYKDETHPDELLTPNATYTRAGRHWYDLSNARTAIGITQDNKTLVLFTVDGTNGGHGMQGGEVADLLRNDYLVWNALNLDGGGSTTLAAQDPVTLLRGLVNTPAENPPRPEATNFAVYSDGLDPITAAVATPAANARGWNKTAVAVSLSVTDLASGIADNPPGWVDQVQYSLAGAQAGAQVVPGSAAAVGISTPGVTTLSYSATDAAGNEETAQSLTVRIDGAPPVISGMPEAGCQLASPHDDLRYVATVTSSDPLSGVVPSTFRVTGTSNDGSRRHFLDFDIVILPSPWGAYYVFLRAEKSDGREDRTYTLTATATDRADNVTTVTSTCVVPRRPGHGHGRD